MEIVPIGSIVILFTVVGLFGLTAFALIRFILKKNERVVEHEMTRSEFDHLIASKEAHARAPLQEQIGDLERTVAAQQVELVRLRQGKQEP